MARLSKAEIKAHDQAVALLRKDVLTLDEREFVLEHWQEGATHVNSAAGAFFTPSGLADCVALHVGDARRVIDLCAGIGALAFAALRRWGPPPEIVCVEVNPDYVAVGRKVLPEATWITADVLDLPGLGRFDCAISNPPFGKTPKRSRDTDALPFDLAVVRIAAGLTDYGVFILPSGSVPFSYSGRPNYEPRESRSFDKLHALTGVEMSCGSVDCAVYRDDWKGVSPAVELVTCEFPPAAQADLFREAA